MNTKQFIQSIAEEAGRDMKRSGILASITIAQACLESAYGTSELAVQAKNLFGMKASLSGNTWASDWGGAVYTKATREQDAAGNEYTITADFRNYHTTEQSIRDHSDYLTGAMNGKAPRYAGLPGCRDYRLAAQMIKDGGYATDVRYVEKLCWVIENHNLTLYDESEDTMQIINALLTVSDYNRPGTERKTTKAVACHYIGNPGTGATANRNYFESLRTTHSTKASCHYIIGLDGEILKLIPEHEISWCTNQANSYTISIEACHPDQSGKFTDATYASYVKLCADICGRWGLDPLNGGLIRHYDVTGKACPKYFVDVPAAWEQFKTDVAGAMVKQTTMKKSGWHEEDGGRRFYLGDTGNRVQNDWYKDGGKWYWFDGAGMMVSNTWKMASDNKWYYLTADGAMARNEWAIWDKELYWLTEDGSIYEGRLNLITDGKGALHITSE